MNIVIISRHPAAVEFIHRELPQTIGVPVITGNATPDDVRGMNVIGNVPLHLASIADSVTAIEFDGPPPRGMEYTLDDMDSAGARLTKYVVRRA